ncbi:MAG: ribosome small subunit-dependent GTPase A [Bacteroidales bacterium]|nr:ribosome small subunit-dependent GTPase A [Bacteroidales bacterium]
MNKGLVIKTTGSWHTIKDKNKVILCKLKGKLRTAGIRTTNPVAVGDIVNYELSGDNQTGLIRTIQPRKNYIIRKATNLSKESHLLAANVDLALLMITLAFPETTTEFIDRFLVTAEAYHIPTILVINKIELYNEILIERSKQLISIYNQAGYRCIEISVKKKIGIPTIQKLLENKITVIAGNSGVGKSSLINVLDKNINIKIGSMSDYHKSGKHTTTYPEMFDIGNESYIIDTPGIKGFGLIDFNEMEIGYFFPDIFKLSKECHFYNCTHIHEPGCAVKYAVENNLLSESRYKSYYNIFSDKNEKYRT